MGTCGKSATLSNTYGGIGVGTQQTHAKPIGVADCVPTDEDANKEDSKENVGAGAI
jgi:hypothetical protein